MITYLVYRNPIRFVKVYIFHIIRMIGFIVNLVLIAVAHSLNLSIKRNLEFKSTMLKNFVNFEESCKKINRQRINFWYDHVLQGSLSMLHSLVNCYTSLRIFISQFKGQRRLAIYTQIQFKVKLEYFNTACYYQLYQSKFNSLFLQQFMHFGSKNQSQNKNLIRLNLKKITLKPQNYKKNPIHILLSKLQHQKNEIKHIQQIYRLKSIKYRIINKYQLIQYQFLSFFNCLEL
ncbi:unnamed protein product [Paramecium octaurelia]|uniref:Transmembrane protein n=1 Tax=Paramecium octaurelia TaxID=43137 RepID=A0A8S1UM10_PAROT|nr:unnamed protein product [Paramecium octaurelia]